MCLEGCSPVGVLEAKLAVMLFTSSTLNTNCGTNQLSKGTVLFPGLGQCSISYSITNFSSSIHNCVFHASQNLLMFINRHSSTLLPNKLVIFGGRKTAAYLNDLYILDLGNVFIHFWSICGKCDFWKDVTNSSNYHLRLYGILSSKIWKHATTCPWVSAFWFEVTCILSMNYIHKTILINAYLIGIYSTVLQLVRCNL